MTPKKRTFSVDQIQQIEIGRNGNIMPRIRDLEYDSTLKGSLLSFLYPGIRVASVLVPVEMLEEIEEHRVRATMAKLSYKGINYKLVGAASSAKKGLFYFVDENHQKAIAERFQNWPQAAITYFGILVSNCRTVEEIADCRVLVVSDKCLGTNDCRGWIRESMALSKLNLRSGSFAQFRIAFDKVQGKGSLKIMSDEAADLLRTDIILPDSAIKPGFKVPARAFEFFGRGRRFQGQTIIGIREVARPLEFESSYTLTQHAPGESILTEILPQTKSQIEKVSNAVGEGRYEELLELIGHHPANRPGLQPEEEVGTVEGLLLADTSGHIVRHPWVNAQLDKLLTRWTYKACTGGAFRLRAFALADDGYLLAADGKIYSGADWLSTSHSISALKSERGLCVRYPIRMYEDLLPTRHMSRADAIEAIAADLYSKGCPSPFEHAEKTVDAQVLLDGTYVLHSETAKLNGGDFDFDLVGVIDEDRFPLWVADRFNLTEQFPLTKTKASKERHPWWNIVHVARKAVGNQKHMPSRTNVDLFLADPLATELPLPEFDPKQMRFAYRLQLAHGNDDEQVLEEVFRIFNIDHPRDYLKRSLSTGDVVTIDAKRSYRCDLAGWVALNPAVTRAWSETLREMLGKSGNCLRRRNRLRLSCRTRGCVVAETPECSRCFTDYDSPEFLHTGFLEHLARFRSSLGRRVVHKCENCGSRIWLASESQFCSDQCFRDWIPF